MIKEIQHTQFGKGTIVHTDEWGLSHFVKFEHLEGLYQLSNSMVKHLSKMTKQDVDKFIEILIK